MPILWGAAGLFLAILAQAVLRLAFHYGKSRQWEPCLAYTIFGLMLVGTAVMQFCRALQ
jgi:hypothetical protein